MSKIKVVHVVNSDVGLKSHLGNYMRYQLEKGYDVSAITSPGKWLTHDTTILDSISVKIIPLRPQISPMEDLHSLVKMTNYFQSSQFDIVHTHTIKPGLLGRIGARLAGVPIIMHTFHGLNIYDHMPVFQYYLFKFIETLGCACGDSVLSQSRDDMEIAIKERICPSAKLHYLGNGVDLECFNPIKIQPSEIVAIKSELGILPHQKVIGFIGRLEREKGIFEFIEAINILKREGVQAKYLLIGPQQPEKSTAISPNEILQMCEARDDLIMMGYRTDIPALLATMDVVTLPSYHEGIPRCLMESAAMGKPVVATCVRGIQETVVDGITGILIPPHNSSALAKELFKIINNSDLQEKIGKGAREYALKSFDERLAFERADIEYRRLIKEKMNVDYSL